MLDLAQELRARYERRALSCGKPQHAQRLLEGLRHLAKAEALLPADIRPRRQCTNGATVVKARRQGALGKVASCWARTSIRAGPGPMEGGLIRALRGMQPTLRGRQPTVEGVDGSGSTEHGLEANRHATLCGVERVAIE